MMDLKIERFTVYGGEFAHEPAGGMRDRMKGYDTLCKEVWTDAQL